MPDTPGARDRRGRMTRISVLSGSPVVDSRTWSLTTVVGRCLDAQEFDVQLIDLRALPPADLLHGPGDAGPVRATLDIVARAHGIVVATPVHHAAYSGILKAFLDLLPRSGLAGKVALPLAVGGSPAHVLALDYALRPVLVSLGAVHVTRGQFLLCTEIERAANGTPLLQGEAERRLESVLREFVLGLRLHVHDGVGLPVAPDAVPLLMSEP